MLRTQKQASRGRKKGQPRGRLAGLSQSIAGTAARFAPQIALAAAAAGAAALAIKKMTEAAVDNAKRISTLTEQLRQRAVLGRTFQQQQAINAAQLDPLARGAGFASQRMQQQGTQITSEQIAAGIKLTLAQQQLTEAMNSFKSTIAVEVNPMLSRFIENMAKTTRGAGNALRSTREFATNFAEEMKDLDVKNYPGLNFKGTGERRDRRMMEALRNQAMAQRASDRTTKSFAGNLGQAQTAEAGRASEYQFFVRRQNRERNEELQLAREDNRSLKDIAAAMGAGPSTGPSTGSAPATVGVP